MKKLLPHSFVESTVKIPLNRVSLCGDEFRYAHQAVTLNHLSGNGEFTRKCEKLLADLLAVRKVLLTTSGTHALEVSALLLDLRPGDEFIVPSFTFPSTANAFLLRGARPVLWTYDRIR